MIKGLQVENFKSLKQLDVPISPMTFVIGANASGKSNFVESLDFLSHALRENLQYAVSEKGGFFAICHRRQRRAKGAVRFNVGSSINVSKELNCEFSYSFALKTIGEDIRAEYFVDEESLDLNFVTNDQNPQFLQSMRIAREPISGDEKNESKYVMAFTPPLDFMPSGTASNDLKPMIDSFQSIGKFFEQAVKPERQNLLLSGMMRGFPLFSNIVEQIAGIRVFQLNPRIARQPSAPSIHGELGRRGENLAAAVDQMQIADPEGFRTMASWIKDVVPTLKGVFPDYTDTRQLGLFFEEEGIGTRWYAEDMSDGTIMSLALFLALLDKRHRTVVIEEPENTLHPWILRKFLTRCRELTPSRQIIITTHSPLAVASARPGELFVIERKAGISTMRHASEVEPALDSIMHGSTIDLGQYWLAGGVGAVPTTPDSNQDELFGPSDQSDEDRNNR
jgi:predicted ATPase